MARDERKRQKKLERKRAKRQEALVRNERGMVAAWPSLEKLAGLPVHECWLDPDLLDRGLGHALVARTLSPGRVAVGSFLLDAYCLGIKNAFGALMTPSELRAHVFKMKDASNLVQQDAAYVKKLILELETWARGIGFSPHPDFQDAKRVLVGISCENCAEQFTFGKDGKPFFVNGPFDRPFRVNQIMQTLLRTCGEGNYHFLAMVGGPPGTDGTFEDEDVDE